VSDRKIRKRRVISEIPLAKDIQYASGIKFIPSPIGSVRYISSRLLFFAQWRFLYRSEWWQYCCVPAIPGHPVYRRHCLKAGLQSCVSDSGVWHLGWYWTGRGIYKIVFDAVDAQAISIPVDKEGSGSGGHFHTGLYPQVNFWHTMGDERITAVPLPFPDQIVQSSCSSIQFREALPNASSSRRSPGSLYYACKKKKKSNKIYKLNFSAPIKNKNL